MRDDTDRNQPLFDLGSWSIECLEVFATTQQGWELERIRVVAQSHAYRSDEPRDVRLRWATLALTANERLPGGSPWQDARKIRQNFALRTWIIEHLGPGCGRDWDPEALAADTLAVLSLGPSQVAALSASWRDLPIERIGDLRRYRSATAHLDRLLDFVAAGPTKDLLISWAEVRKRLP